MNRIVTFDGAPPPGTINFGLGQPSANLLPLDLLRRASDTFFRTAQAVELNYGVRQGDERFLHSLAGFLSDGYSASVNEESLFVTGGNSQALDFVSTVFANSGDTVFVEEPSYFLAFQIFRDHGLNIVSIPTDDEGLDLAALRRALQIHKPAFIYTIPSYHNPGGHCLGADRRRQLVELSRQHDFLIVADEVYQLLCFDGEAPPAFGTMIDSGSILSLGSFSKILAPALRLGWIQTSANLRARLLQNGFCNSGGSINHFASHIVREMIDQRLLQRHIAFLKETLGSRRDAMDQALNEQFAALANWQRPLGGYFFWLRFADGVDTTPLKDAAVAVDVGFQPGAVFSKTGALENCMRLSFAHYDEDDIAKGIRRVRSLF